MRYLIDTNLLIDFVEEDNISTDIYEILDNCENLIYVSSESVKEYIHLWQNGKIMPNRKLSALDVFEYIENTVGFNVKFIAKEHLHTLAKLDLVEGHNDPSDRLIIAQAMTEKMSLISSDKKFPKYRKMGLDLIVSR